MVKLTMVTRLWKYQTEIVQLIKQLRNLRISRHCHLPLNSFIVKICTKRLILYFVLTLYTITIIGNISTCYALCRSPSALTRFKHNGYLKTICDWMNWVTKIEFSCYSNNFTLIELSLIILGILAHVSRNTFAYLPDTFSATLALTLWSVVYLFSKNLKERQALRKREEWLEVYEDFKAVKDIARLVNKVAGSLFLWHLIEFTAYYSLRFQRSFVDCLTISECDSLFHMISFLPGAIGVLIVSADICHQVRHFSKNCVLFKTILKYRYFIL